MRILVVEDEQEVANYICKGLREYGHVVEHSADGKEGLFLATTEQFDLIILDRMLPFVDGLVILKTLRATGNTVPLILLSALGEVDDRVQGLRAGGDDYITKPFAFSELLARIEALLRRHMGEAETVTRICIGDMELDLLARIVKRNGVKIPLQAREYSLLEYLVRHKGQIVTRTMLLDNVWHYHFDPQTNVIDVHVSRLRRKIDGDSENPLIKTVRGSGYMIDDPHS
ncbi:MAG: DNA-binding response regulator [Alphaproteobacteria bacterium]|nr:MAG: DNA-binding response regulator [Alphaproteobacteria bacterium]